MFLSWYEGFSDVQDYIYIAHRTASYEPNRKLISRFHGAIEIELVINGEFEVDINNVRRRVKGGDLIFVDSFEEHQYYYRKGIDYWVIVISPSFFDKGNALNDITFPRVNGYCEGFDVINEFLNFSLNHWKADSIGYKSGFVNMLIGLMKQYYPVQPKENAPHKDKTMINIIKFINENSKSDLSISEIAEKFNYTPNYLSNMFNKFTGMSFRDYLNWVRMLGYTRLKQNKPDITDAEAAEMCGFNCVQSFYRAKKRFNSIPFIPMFL